MAPAPRVGDTVHYVSYGTPGGEYPSTCRAAIVTEVGADLVLGLAVLNPEGFFFNRGVKFNDGSEVPGAPDCPNVQQHGNPFRYCSCGWMEPSLVGGTWHWPESA